MRELLPDATFADWAEIGRALERAIASPPSDPVVPDSNLAAYSSTPLPRKLGIKEGSVVCLVGAPEGSRSTACPGRRRAAARGADLTMVWVRSAVEAERVRDRPRATRRSTTLDRVGEEGLAALQRRDAGDVREPGIRRLRDFKVCEIDATWTALRFKRRR